MDFSKIYPFFSDVEFKALEEKFLELLKDNLEI